MHNSMNDIIHGMSYHRLWTFAMIEASPSATTEDEHLLGCGRKALKMFKMPLVSTILM